MDISFLEVAEPGVPAFEEVSFVGERDLARSVDALVSSLHSHVAKNGLWDFLTSSPGLSLFSPLNNLLFELSGPFFVLFIALIPQLFDSQQKVIDVFGAIGIGGDRHLNVCVRHRFGLLQSMDYGEEEVLINNSTAQLQLLGVVLESWQ